MMGDFHGLPTRTLSSAHLRLEFLAEAGPRIVRLAVNGATENLLAEAPDSSWRTPLGEYHVRGGHRLWHAPEASPRTYVPDDCGLTVHEVPGGVELRQPTEVATGIQKSLAIRLHPDRPALTLTHRLSNEGLWPVETAPWAITQLPLGGVIILPQPASELPGGDLNYRARPNRHLVLWSYARWEDARLQVHDDYFLFQAQPHAQFSKFGYLNTHGWAAYLRGEILFVKQFHVCPDAPHPDRNCNVEVYCDDRLVELETLAPLTHLAPGQSVTHEERWCVFTGLHVAPTYEYVRAHMRTIDLQAAPGIQSHDGVENRG
jgi:hypothetical protein